ncbi:MAG: hypothetical protein AAGA99_00545 [Actinomycetota bacterium]
MSEPYTVDRSTGTLEEWTDSEPVRLATDRATGIESLADFLQLVLDATDELAEAKAKDAEKLKGLELEALTDLIRRVKSRDPGPVMHHPEGREALRQLFLLAVPAHEVADLLGCTSTDVDNYVNWKGMSERGREVIDLHLSGHTATQIAEKVGITRPAVHRHITKAGYQPNLKQSRPLDEDQKERIIRSYQNGVGPVDIGRRERVTRNQVSHCLRQAAKAGLVEYPREAA